VIVAVCALSAAMLTGACAAGQQAATSEEKPTLDGTFGSVGKIQLEGVAFRAPSGASYATGSAVPMSAYIVNNSNSADKLVKVSSSAFSGGWDVVPTPTLGSKGSSGSGNGRPQTIGAGSAIGFGLENLSPSGAGSPESLVLLGLSKQNAPLFPGGQVSVTFTFANAGQTTLVVPVKLSSSPNTMTLPNEPAGPTA
jgi:hypothetical protein